MKSSVKYGDGYPPTGAALLQAAIPGHTVENVGKADCKLIMFEPQ